MPRSLCSLTPMSSISLCPLPPAPLSLHHTQLSQTTAKFLGGRHPGEQKERTASSTFDDADDADGRSSSGRARSVLSGGQRRRRSGDSDRGRAGRAGQTIPARPGGQRGRASSGASSTGSSTTSASSATGGGGGGGGSTSSAYADLVNIVAGSNKRGGGGGRGGGSRGTSSSVRSAGRANTNGTRTGAADGGGGGPMSQPTDQQITFGSGPLGVAFEVL